MHALLRQSEPAYVAFEKAVALSEPSGNQYIIELTRRRAWVESVLDESAEAIASLRRQSGLPGFHIHDVRLALQLTPMWKHPTFIALVNEPGTNAPLPLYGPTLVRSSDALKQDPCRDDYLATVDWGCVVPRYSGSCPRHIVLDDRERLHLAQDLQPTKWTPRGAAVRATFPFGWGREPPEDRQGARHLDPPDHPAVRRPGHRMSMGVCVRQFMCCTQGVSQ